MHTVNYVGVDLSKRELVADLDAKAKPRTFPNNPKGFAALIKALPANAHVVCESTGGYQCAMVRALHAAGVPVSVVMPVRVRAFAQAQGLRAKTDPIDARLLTAFGAAMHPRALTPASPQQEELQQLMRARQVLIALQNDQASHAEHCTVSLLQAQHQARAVLLRQQILAIERRVRELLAADEKSQWRTQRLQEVCGVGKITAWTVLAELPELGTLQPGQPAGLVGVAPDPDDSGPRHGPRRVGGGRGAARKVLYMAALTASQRNTVLAPFYRRLVEQHKKPKPVALVAVMRKLIELLNRMLADPNFKLAS